MHIQAHVLLLGMTCGSLTHSKKFADNVQNLFFGTLQFTSIDMQLCFDEINQACGRNGPAWPLRKFAVCPRTHTDMCVGVKNEVARNDAYSEFRHSLFLARRAERHCPQRHNSRPPVCLQHHVHLACNVAGLADNMSSRDQRPDLLRSVIKRVHPDLFSAWPDAREINSESLKVRPCDLLWSAPFILQWSASCLAPGFAPSCAVRRPEDVTIKRRCAPSTCCRRSIPTAMTWLPDG